MEIKFNIEKSQRKALAQKIAEISGNTVQYLGAPTFSYQIGDFTLNKDSVLIAETVDEKLLAELANSGYHYEVNEEPDKLTVQMPVDSISERTLNRVRRIIENKGELFKSAFKTDSLEFQVTEKAVDFPWFTIEQDGDADELHHIYEQQTDLRNLLKKESEQLMQHLAENISQNNNFDVELIDFVAKLHDQLSESKGKKVYGYLKSDVKKTVDEIFVKLASNESIKKMYELWCEMEQQKHDVYSSAKVQFPKLVDNKEFKSVKNMIVQTVMQMEFPMSEIEIEMPESTEIDFDIPLQIDEELINENVDNSVESSPQNKLYIKWSDSYKEAHKLIFNKESTLEDYKKAEQLLLSESNNVLALYDLGKLYSMEKSGLKDDEKSFGFYEKALQEFLQIEPTAKKLKPYLQYQIGMMYFKGLGTSIDNQKAVEYLGKSVELRNQYAKRLLALEYIGGEKFEQDIEKGISLLTECADGGDAFSCYKLGNLYLKGEIVDQDLDKAEKYLLFAEDNEFTQYALGKLYMQKEKYNFEKAISYFEKSADKNMQASYQLGRLYFFGADGLEKDKEKAMECLNLSAEQGNEYAQNILENQEKFENEMLANTIFSLFVNLSRCIEDDYHKNFQSGRKMIDSKLRRMIQEKNQALGIKQEHGQTQEY